MKIGIIGGGPAGISLGIQLKRLGINSVIFEKNEIGGCVRDAYKIFNLLGFPQGIEGVKYANLIKKTSEIYKLDLIFDEIKEINYIEKKFVLIGIKKYEFDILVIASGTDQKKYKGFDEFNSIQEIKNKKNVKIGIIGGSDVGFDYGLSLKNNGEIFILHKSERPKAIKHLQKFVFENKNINYLNNCKIEKIEKIKNKIKVILERNKKKISISFDFLLNATGRVPEKRFCIPEFLRKEKKLLKNGLLYMIGDVAHPKYRQISIALGDGVLTAQKIYEKILRYEDNK